MLSVFQLLEGGGDSDVRKRRRRQTQDFLQPYIAAKLDLLPETFVLGDEKSYNSYYNKPLPGQQQYRTFIMAELKDRDSVSHYKLNSLLKAADEDISREEILKTAETLKTLLYFLSLHLALVLTLMISYSGLQFCSCELCWSRDERRTEKARVEEKK